MTGPRWSHVLLGLCALALTAALVRVAVHDPTDQPVSGDQASFTYQALSLLGGDLAYDASDQERWIDLGWQDQPSGLFVQQRDDGWAFAKPIGYSVLLAPALAIAGARGISLLGAALLLAYASCWYGIGRMRWDRATAAAVATVATVASHAWFFAFPAHADLFVAALVGAAALGAARAASQPERAATGWMTVAAMASALLVTEKLPALVALAPLLVVAFVRAPMRARLVAMAVGAVVLVVSVTPYLFYSDGASWSAYGGDRFYAIATTPWSGGRDTDLTPWRTRDALTPAFVFDAIAHPSDELPSATLTYAVGRHTGVATFLPIVPALTGAAIVGWWHRRKHPDGQHPDDQRPDGQRHDDRDHAIALAAAGGLLAYVGLYIVVFTDNYFGGGQSVGNRYFLQVSLLVAVAAMAGGVTARHARWCAGAAAMWAVVVLGPQLWHADDAFYRIERSSPAQRLLPFDGSQTDAWRFQCEPIDCVAPPLQSYGDD
ncbi:MAG: hypothetical protein WD691_12525 [Acidimicrobiales bacterium]